MNDGIKEILDNLRKCCDITKDQSFVVYQRQDILKLLDYITNLQQDYKSRCEKAVEYIKEHTTSFGDVFIPASESWYLSDILNGRSDE